MKREILHVDVNNAFLSWLAVYKLKNGEKIILPVNGAILTTPSNTGLDKALENSE